MGQLICIRDCIRARTPQASHLSAPNLSVFFSSNRTDRGWLGIPTCRNQRRTTDRFQMTVGKPGSHRDSFKQST